MGIPRRCQVLLEMVNTKCRFLVRSVRIWIFFHLFLKVTTSSTGYIAKKLTILFDKVRVAALQTICVNTSPDGVCWRSKPLENQTFLGPFSGTNTELNIVPFRLRSLQVNNRYYILLSKAVKALHGMSSVSPDSSMSDNKRCFEN